MQDYKYRTVRYFAKARQRKALPPPSSRGGRGASPRRTSGEGHEPGYQFRFYAVIAVMVFCTAVYVRYQYLHNPDSVFAEIVNYMQGGIEARRQDFARTRAPRPQTNQAQVVPTNVAPAAVAPSTTAPSNSISPRPPSALVTTIFVPEVKGRSVALRPVEEVLGNTQVPFRDGLNRLLAYRPPQGGVRMFDEKTILRRAWLENGVLCLDFNRNFEYSRFGHLGLELQVQQVLWTAFGISDREGGEKVTRISILIDGKRRDRIGGEGMAMKLFYSRSDLRRTFNAGSPGSAVRTGGRNV